MHKIKKLLLVIIVTPCFLLLVWQFAVPTRLIHERIIDAVSVSAGNNVEVNLTGLKKNLFLSLHAETVEIISGGIPAILLNDIDVRLSPIHLFRGKPAVLVKGTIGKGDFNAVMYLSRDGRFNIDNASIEAITYLNHYGVSGKGNLSSEATFDLTNNSAEISLEIPDLDLKDSEVSIPFADSLNRIQGSMTVNGNRVEITSLSLEGDKGYARLAGLIVNDQMDLKLEIMPEVERLTKLESMLISNYLVSPGYYVIPIKGPFLL